ncbi:MAG: thiamine-phosphate kinase [Flavobacteriales bacterium]
MERTELGQLGEFGLIEHLTKDIELKQPSSVKGVGDDAAVIDRGDHFELISTDLLVEGVHFDMSYTPLKHLGYKAVAVNLSDICAMNGTPTHITVSLAISSRFPVEAISEVYDGIKLCCDQYNVDLIGGDTTSSLTGLMISVTAMGKVDKDKVVYRSGAKENDLLCVSGDLGAAYIGLQILEREKEIWKENPDVQPDLEGFDYVLERILKPEPRADIIQKLAGVGIVPTSMIDISDGLGSEILHLCKNSKCGARVYDEKLPIDATTAAQCQEFKLEPSVCALNGGEDYELLFTVDQKNYDKVSAMKEVTVIGHMMDKSSGAAIIYPQGEEIEIKAQGWKSF